MWNTLERLAMMDADLSLTLRAFRVSFPVTVIMLLWPSFSIVILLFPTTTNPTSQDMNYAVVMSGGWILLCIVYYFTVYGDVHWFKDPVANGEVEGDPRPNREKSEPATISHSEKHSERERGDL